MLQRRSIGFFLACISFAFLSSCQGRAERVRQRNVQEQQENQRQLTQALRESHRIVYQTNVDLKGLMRRDNLARPLSLGQNTIQVSSEYDQLYIVFPYLNASTKWEANVAYEVEIWEGQVRQRRQKVSQYGLNCELLLQLGREVQDNAPVEVNISITRPSQFGIKPFLYSECPLNSTEKGAAMMLRRYE